MRLSYIFGATGACMAAMLMSSAAVAGPALLDGSFESFNYTNGEYHYNPTGSAWTFDGGAGVTANNSAWGFPTAPDGNNVAFLQNDSSISQMLTGLTVGKTYDLDFDIIQRPNYGVNDVNFTVGVGDTVFNESATEASWTHYSVSFTANSASELLSLNGTNGNGDNDAGVDNFTLSSADGAVPEPASWAMMLCGFGTVGAAMRQRQRAKVRFA